MVNEELEMEDTTKVKNEVEESSGAKSKEMMAEINERLSILHSLKQHRFPFYWDYYNKYRMRNSEKLTPEWFVDYSMNTQFAIVNTKASELLANTPKYDFIAMDDDAKRYKKVRELHWNYVWQVSGTDRANASIIFDALKYGIGVGKEVWACEKRKIKKPVMTEWVIMWTEEEVVDYEGCKLIYVPWNNVWLNWPNIELTTEAAVVTYYDRSQFFEVFGSNPMYSGITEDNIPKGKYYYIQDNSDKLTFAGSPSSTDFGWENSGNADIVSVLEYWNKYEDEYIVMANGVWINPLSNGEEMPNPNPSKEIPLVVYTDHPLEDDIYGMGEFDITQKSSALKDVTRSLSIETVKAQWGIITIDPDSEFDDAIMQLGIRKYARVEKDAFGFFAPNINASTLQYIEEKANEDIIIETGIDFRNQLLSPNETATKTQGKNQAAMKRINLNIKYNAFHYWERLARLRMANMEFYADKARTIPVKNMEVDNEGNVTYMNNSYGLFTMMPKYFKWKMALMPRIDSMMWDTSTEIKQKYMEALQLLGSMIDRDTGKPIYDPRSLVEAWRWIIDDVIDLDRINEKRPVAKSAESIMKELKWIQPEMAGGAIPPEQMSWKPVILPSSPWTPSNQ